jgi:3-hydroxyisobutyrate dehydrogenase-like beta-hydroxyacid dehydrogenase
MRTAIIGLGYVGRSIAQAEVGVGHSETGFHSNSGVISSLSVSGDFKGTI